ncbi:MAG: site-specific integrase [Cyclobacteriaceae bacterium]|nr:site-specific integrase [Cyclobacteriaceae bacterium]
MGLSVKFYLESKVKGDKGKHLPIFLYIRRKGERAIKISTDRKCNRGHWDVNRCRAKARWPAAAELNGFLSDVEEEVASQMHSNLRKGILTSKREVKDIIAKLSGKELKRINLISFAIEFVEKSNFARNTKKGYQTTINALKEYSERSRKILDFSMIDLNFYDDYTGFLWKEKELNDNTVGTHIKHIKTIMNEAFERDLHSNLKFKRKGFVVFRKDSDSVYLSESEISSLLAIDLRSNQKLERVRDVFCINCWLGLRYSDLVRVTKDKIIEENGMTLLKIETEKTGQIVRVPINPKARPLLEKYGYNLPAISPQKFNEYLKEVTAIKRAGLDIPVEITHSRAGQKVRKTVPKYELITSHTARRSFATNLYLQGVPSQHIMTVTGHKTEKAFRAYLKLSDMEKVREIDRHFKKQAEMFAA